MSAHETSALVLASASPRRGALLRLLDVPFVTMVADIDESERPGEEPAPLALRLSMSKAEEVAARLDRPALVLAADTIVVLDGVVLGKPRDADDARSMLKALRGRVHGVITGLSALAHPTGRTISQVVTTQVTMRNYGSGEIEAYVASGDPLDKAGAYAIQSTSFAPVARIEGCYTNVVGLPLCRVASVLAALGVAIPTALPRACRRQGACTFSSTPGIE